MLKQISKILFSNLIIIFLSGCSFIVAENPPKYYGMEKQKGDEFLGKILDIQDQLSQAKQTEFKSQKSTP